MIDAIFFSETSVLIRATRRNIQGDGILGNCRFTDLTYRIEAPPKLRCIALL
jgi:hypothetical protein